MSDPEIEALRRQITNLEQRVRTLEDLRQDAAVNVPALATNQTAAAPPSSPSSPSSTFESRVGSQWFNRLGIVAVLAGVAWFLKFAVDQQWLGPVARIAVGVAAGLAVMAWSERFLRKGYLAFSYSLKAAGSGFLYLALWAAYALYHLLPTAVVLPAMIAIAAWNGWSAWKRSSELLAGLGLLGSLLTPLLLTLGGPEGVGLFVYLVVLLATVLPLAAVRVWPRLALGALLGTATVAAQWSFTSYRDPAFTTVYVFLVVAGGMFALTPVSLGRRGGMPEGLKGAIGWLVVLTAVLGYAGLFWLLRVDAGRAAAAAAVAQARVALCFVLIYTALGLLAFRTAASEAGTQWLRLLHLMLAAAFLMVASFLYLHGVWITLAWSIEGVLLLWAGFRAGRAPLRWQALALLAMAIAKVFLFDTQQMAPLLRILSFLGLGVVLLAVSFVYQRDLLRLRS